MSNSCPRCGENVPDIEKWKADGFKHDGCLGSVEARLSARVEQLESVLKFVRGEVLFYRETQAAGFVLKSALAACDGALDPTQPVRPVQPVTRSSVRSVGQHAPECVRTYEK